MANENPEGDLGNGELSKVDREADQLPKPNAVVYVSDYEHGKQRIGSHYPGQHGYQYQDVEGAQPPQT
jgi:hypothetical protein